MHSLIVTTIIAPYLNLIYTPKINTNHSFKMTPHQTPFGTNTASRKFLNTLLLVLYANTEFKFVLMYTKFDAIYDYW